jgi:hypothetical protein
VLKASPLLLAVAIGLVSPGTVAHAQQPRPERPYRGLFASGGSSDTEQSLTATGAAGIGYDTSVLAEAGEAGFGGSPSSPRPSEEGGFTLLSEGLSYSLSKRRLGLNATQSAALRYYPTLERSTLSNYSGGVGASWSPSTRTQFSANQTVTYQPMNMYALFPVFQTTPLGQVYLADLDFGTVDAGYSTYRTALSASRRLSSRSTLAGDYSYEKSDFKLYPDFSSASAGARFTRSLGAGLSVRLGYTYTRTRYARNALLAGQHGIDSGVNYARRCLSLAERR